MISEVILTWSSPKVTKTEKISSFMSKDDLLEISDMVLLGIQNEGYVLQIGIYLGQTRHWTITPGWKVRSCPTGLGSDLCVVTCFTWTEYR